MRVLLLNWKDPAQADAGGAERYVERVAQTWSSWGHAVTVVIPRAGTTDTHADKVEWVRLGTRHTIFHQATRYLRRMHGSFDVVVESVSTRPFRAHRVAGDKAFALYHQVAEDVWNQEYPFPVSWAGRYFVEPRWIRAMRDARVVAVSPSTRGDLARHGVATMGIVPPGSDAPVAAAPRVRPRGARLLFVGRLVRTKRPDDAVAAFARIRSEFPEASLDVVGSGYMHRHLTQMAIPGVHLHGSVSETAKYEFLARADLMLLPATREGWGIVAIEAARQALPVVGYDVGGLRDAVRSGATGILTAPSPSALADAAVALLRDHSRWTQYSSAALEWGRQFTWEHASRTLMSLISSEPALVVVR